MQRFTRACPCDKTHINAYKTKKDKRKKVYDVSFVYGDGKL